MLAMPESVYDARSELADPRRFVERSLGDLRRSVPISWRFFLASLRGRHRRSLFGYVWLLAPAAAATSICVYLQSRGIFRVGDTQLPYAVHVLSGLVLWQTFVDALNSPLQQLWASRAMITRSRVPHEAILLSGLYDVALNCLVRLAALAAVLAVFRVAPAASVLLFPLGMLVLALLGFAFGLAATPFGLLYDDVRHGILLLAGFWFFLTPVLYPAPAAGPLRFNPVTPLLDTSRSWILSHETGPGFFLVAGAAAVLLVGAWVGYRIARPHLIARLG